MPDSVRISGWLFVDQETKTIIYVSSNGKSDETGLPWDLLFQPGNIEEFRRDFLFKELKLNTFYRFKIDVEVDSLQRWFQIRQELR